MRIHLQSDTHNEFGYKLDQTIESDVTICAGDIGVMSNRKSVEATKEYFLRLKDKANRIIWVLGNHEHYSGVYEKTLDTALDIANSAGVHLMDVELNTDNLEIDGVTFWGSTFWTDLNSRDYFAEKTIQKNLNDFHCVVKNGKLFTAEESSKINEWSRMRINWKADVVVTHHCPIIIPNPRFDITPISYAFYNTQLDDKIAESNIQYWFYGHTHHSTTKELDGTRVTSNQLGYKMDSYEEESTFDEKFLVEVN